MAGVAAYRDASDAGGAVDVSGDDLTHCLLTRVDQSGPGGGAVDPQHGNLGRGDQVAVAEVQTEEICVGARGGQIIRRIGAPGTSRPCRLALSTTFRAISVEPVADGPLWETKITADFAEG